MIENDETEEDKRALYETAILGKLTEDFLSTDLGVYMVRRAEAEVDQALEQLKKVNPTDTLEITRLQNKIAVAESVQRWLAESIQAGWRSTQLLEDR